MTVLENIASRGGKRLITACEHPQIATWGIFNETVLEAPLYLGKSQIETEFVGAFTFVNLRSVHHETTNCAIECQRIGRFCMFAHSVNVGFAGHPTDFISNHLVFRYDAKTKYAHDFMPKKNMECEKSMRSKYIECSCKPLPVIGNDCWIGFGATILNGVYIADGTVVAAGAVVTKNTEPYSIVAGNPARIVRKRFAEKYIEKLLKLRWWEYGPDVLYGIDLSETNSGISELTDRVISGKYKKYVPPTVVINNRTNEVTIRGIEYEGRG